MPCRDPALPPCRTEVNGVLTTRRIALVTGAARGLGYAIAQRLGEQGHHVVLHDRLPQVSASAATLTALGLSAEALVGECADEAEVSRLVQGVISQHGSIDILVNNAGISPKHNGQKRATVDTDLGEWREVMRVNLTGPFLMSRACIASMKQRGWGRIVSISSLAGRTGSRYPSTAYSASKAGLIGLSRVLAEELGRSGITVNCIAPGRIETPMSNESGAAVQHEYASRVPVGRLGTPQDIAATVAFLTSDQARFITGTTIDVNGGTFTN